jgi:hypothetical protein
MNATVYKVTYKPAAVIAELVPHFRRVTARAIQNRNENPQHFLEKQ